MNRTEIFMVCPLFRVGATHVQQRQGGALIRLHSTKTGLATRCRARVARGSLDCHTAPWVGPPRWPVGERTTPPSRSSDRLPRPPRGALQVLPLFNRTAALSRWIGQRVAIHRRALQLIAMIDAQHDAVRAAGDQLDTGRLAVCEPAQSGTVHVHSTSSHPEAMSSTLYD